MNLTWLSPKTEKRTSSIHGRGLFAKTDIQKGDAIAVKGGHVYDKAIHDTVEETLGPVDVQIGNALFIGPMNADEVESSMMHLNHSCDPNVGVRGEITFVAMRDIRAGEELTFDYAMTDDEEYSMDCQCGATTCRKKVTGRDWQKKDLQEKYDQYFSLYLLRKM